MQRISDETKEAILERIDLAGLVGETVELKKRGSCFKGLCPFHDEKTPSFDVKTGSDGRWFYFCHGCRATGDAIEWMKSQRGMTFPEAVEHLANRAGVTITEDSANRRISKKGWRVGPSSVESPPAEPEEDLPPSPGEKRKTSFDWQSIVDAFTPAHAARMSKERGFSPEFVDWLHRSGLVGYRGEGFAFPVHNDVGEVVAAHYQTKPKKAGGKKGWAYFPKGGTVTPLVIGDLEEAGHVAVHESQWDALAQLDAHHYHEDPRGLAVVITRGSTAKTDLSHLKVGTLIAIPQNDPISKRNGKGKTPAEEWLEEVGKQKPEGCRLLVGHVPEEFEDLNAWTRDGDPEPQAVQRILTGARDPALDGLLSAADLLRGTLHRNDPDSMVGYQRRFLCRGSSFVITGPSGIGKSTLSMSMVTHWAAGLPWHGITPRKPLTILIVQAENDRGDLEEMIQGAFRPLRDDPAAAIAERNLIFVREGVRTGEDWCRWLGEKIRATGADMVIADPLLSYIGDDISQQKVCSAFLRNWLNPVLMETGAIMVFIHHTGKTSSDSKARSNWNASDYSYIGIGSSEITNWARAMAYICEIPNENGPRSFKFMITKRGERAGMVSCETKEPTTSIYLRHGTDEEGLGWIQVPAPVRKSKKPGRPTSVSSADVFDAFGGEASILKGDLLYGLLDSREVCYKTAANKIKAMIEAGELHVTQKVTKKKGGWADSMLARGSAPTASAI